MWEELIYKILELYKSPKIGSIKKQEPWLKPIFKPFAKGGTLHS